VLIGSAGLFVWAGSSFTYSSGRRVGLLQRVSESGWMCKTYKGDLAMADAPERASSVFHFNVREREVVDRMNELAGREVVLTYEQHKGLQPPCSGDTEYVVTDVRALE